MTTDEFNKILQMQLETCKQSLEDKGCEYTPDAMVTPDCDRLRHFKTAGALMRISAKQALFEMLAKHLVSLADMCKEGKYPLAHWSEKITDSINYLILLRALAEEENG